ncbi:hypothetical protein VNO78_09419 [Psophocarpus tetragonolobus]|uniref:Uncharacterized protein n=1 Tax=Psophocarpus tetragonolobus TaxID=3891 RepID=A0AAN9XU08_PSOTE
MDGLVLNVMVRCYFGKESVHGVYSTCYLGALRNTYIWIMVKVRSLLHSEIDLVLHWYLWKLEHNLKSFRRVFLFHFS